MARPPGSAGSHLRRLEQWLRSYKPEELFDERGRPRDQVLACIPEGARRLGATPHANGGLLLRELPLPELDRYAVPVDKPGATLHEPTRVLGDLLGHVVHDTSGSRDFRLVGPDETASNRLQAVFDASGKAWQAQMLPVDEHPDTDSSPATRRSCTSSTRWSTSTSSGCGSRGGCPGVPPSPPSTTC